MWLGNSMSAHSNQFETLLDRYFKQLLAENPTLATEAGISSARGKLGPVSLDHERRWQQIRLKTLAELERISPGSLSNEQHLDRLALRSQLLRECEDFERSRFALNPSGLNQVLHLLLYELQRGEDEPSRVAGNLRSLLRQTPAYLAASARMIDRPERVWRKIMEHTAAGANSLFQAVSE